MFQFRLKTKRDCPECNHILLNGNLVGYIFNVSEDGGTELMVNFVVKCNGNFKWIGYDIPDGNLMNLEQVQSYLNNNFDEITSKLDLYEFED